MQTGIFGLRTVIETDYCTLRLAYSILVYLSLSQHCKVIFTTIGCYRHEKKKQKVEPAVPQRRKTDEEKVSSKQFQGCSVLHFLVFASNDSVLDALRRLQKGFFLFS